MDRKRMRMMTTVKQRENQDMQSLDPAKVLEPSLEEPSLLKSLLKKKACHVNDLPAEVLREIFDYLSFKDKKNVCLVCKSWCQECTRTFGYSVKLFLTWKLNDTVRLKKCRFERLSVTLFGEFSVLESVWQKIGARIYELKLDGCRITDALIRNVPYHCKNLKFFQFHVSVGNFSFRSDAHLKRMMEICSCSRMETIDIIAFFYARAFTRNEFLHWKQICDGFNLTSCLNRAGRLICRISVASQATVDTSGLIEKLRMNFFRTHKIKDYSVNMIGRK